MNRIIKNWLIVAAALILFAGVLFAGVMFDIGWDFHQLSTAAYTTNTYEVDGDFQNISIDVDTTEIEFVIRWTPGNG